MRRSLRVIVVLFAVLAPAVPAFVHAQVRVSIMIAPPPLPLYAQPACPGDGYIWVPGYWAWDEIATGYYWVPGTWVLPPAVGLLWTPGYWAWDGVRYVFVRGYWGPVVGFYGGIDYGFGYPGHGYYGGRWSDGHFFYNRAVNVVNVSVIRNTYVQNIEFKRPPNRTSYNGGQGVIAHETRQERSAAAREHRLPPTPAQVVHAQAARSIPQSHAAVNHGKPPILTTPRPESFPAATRSRGHQEAARPPAPKADRPSTGNGAERPPEPHAAPTERHSTKQGRASSKRKDGKGH